MKYILIAFISIILLLIPIIIFLKTIKKEKYECNNCNNKFTLTYKNILLSVYKDSNRYLKCPNCNKKSWCKKI